MVLRAVAILFIIAGCETMPVNDHELLNAVVAEDNVNSLSESKTFSVLGYMATFFFLVNTVLFLLATTPMGVNDSTGEKETLLSLVNRVEAATAAGEAKTDIPPETTTVGRMDMTGETTIYIDNHGTKLVAWLRVRPVRIHLFIFRHPDRHSQCWSRNAS